MALNTLREWQLKCPKGELDLAFSNGQGRVESHANIINRGFKPTVVRALGEARYSGLHCLRHFHATWLINRREDGGLGLPLKNVQTRKGHSTLAMTANTYGHLFPSTDDADAMAEAENRLFSVAGWTVSAI